MVKHETPRAPYALKIAAALVLFAATTLAQYPPAGHIDTLVGGGNGDGASALHAIVDPYDLAASNGNLYIADQSGGRIRTVSGGIISTILLLDGVGSIASSPSGHLYAYAQNRIWRIDAGTAVAVVGSGVYGYSGDGGSPLAASLGAVRSVFVGPGDVIYFTDGDFHVVRKVANGVITTVAGTGARGDTGDGGPATAATLLVPYDAKLDGAGTLYILDRFAATIRRVDAGGTITTIAGSHTQGFAGDGGPAIFASFTFPTRIGFDASGNLLVLDAGNNRLRRIDAAGIVNTIAGTGVSQFAGDGGPALRAPLLVPWTLAVDGGVTYIGNRDAAVPVPPFSYENRVRKIDPMGTITSVVALTSNGDGPAAQAVVNPYGLATFGNSLYIADTLDDQVRVLSGFVVGTVAGVTGMPGSSGDGGPATAALLDAPFSVATDQNGGVYVSVRGRIRKISGAVISHIAGTGILGYSGDNGPAVNARIAVKHGLAADAVGNLYLADIGNNRIRKVDAAGTITTIAGTGAFASSGDGGPASQAQVQLPNSIAVASDGTIYFAEAYRVRKITPGGVMQPVCGDGSNGFAGDGGLAINARLSGPASVTLDSAGNLYFYDGGNGRVRRIDPSGIITTVAGNGLTGSGGDGDVATAVPLTDVTGLALDANAHLFIAQAAARRVRVVSLLPQSTVTVDGTVRYYSNGVAVSGVRIATTQTDTTGHYVATVPAGSILVPTKLDDVRAGISSLDAVWVLQANVGMRTLSPAQVFACDVTGNGALSALDASLILQQNVGLIGQFPVAQAHASDWAFEPASATATGPGQHQDFTATLYGDCTGNWR